MTTNNQIVVSAKGVSTLARAKFGPGMLLQHDDLEQLNVYTRELNRLMFRSLFGCGVVCGLVVAAEEDCDVIKITVNSGLAIDCQGDPIYVPKTHTVEIDRKCHPNVGDHLWVELCGTEKCCSPRTPVCGSDDDEAPSVCTRERDGYEIRIRIEKPDCACGCAGPDLKNKRKDGKVDRQAARVADPCACVDPSDPCYKDHYDGICGCQCDDGGHCDCDCVVLVKLDRSLKDANSKLPVWKHDHRVRRFVRPVLMRDPQIELDRKQDEEPGKKPASVPAPPKG